MGEPSSAGGNGQAPTQSASSASGNGQAPATAQADNTSSLGGQSGQAPTAITQQSQASAASSQSDDTGLSADELKRMRTELAEARRDAAKYRDEVRKRDDAQLSAEQKRERDFAELQAKAQAQEAQMQRLHLENAGYRLGSQLGIGDISAALALVQVEHAADIKYGDDGRPENLDELLKAVLKAHPALAAQPGGGQSGQAQRQAASSGGATNPGAGRTTGVFTREQIRRMSPQEYAQNQQAIFEAMKTGQIK